MSVTWLRVQDGEQIRVVEINTSLNCTEEPLLRTFGDIVQITNQERRTVVELGDVKPTLVFNIQDLDSHLLLELIPRRMSNQYLYAENVQIYVGKSDREDCSLTVRRVAN